MWVTRNAWNWRNKLKRNQQLQHPLHLSGLCLQIKHSFHIVHFFPNSLWMRRSTRSAFLQSKRLDKSAWVNFAEKVSPDCHILRIALRECTPPRDCPAHVFETPISWRVCVHDAQICGAAEADLGQDKLKGRSHNQRRLWLRPEIQLRGYKKRTHAPKCRDEKRGKRMRAERVQNTPS